MNYFELFGLPIQFELDGSLLSSQFRALQKRFHPDNFATAAERDRLHAVQNASQINDAYQTLKHPLKRAEYILTLRNLAMPSEQASFQDNMFLMRQMELREMLEEIKHASDVEGAIFSANEELDVEYQRLLMLMQQQLNDNSAESNLPASENLRKLKFYQKLHVELDRIEDQLFDD